MTDPLITAARFLLTQLPWLRHASDDHGGAYAAGVFAEIADCASRMRAITEGPRDAKFLGPCGAPIEVMGFDYPTSCDGDVYGYVGARTGRCKVCGAEHDQDQRRIWLDSQVAGSDLAWTARGIADALGINVKTIRAWATDRYSGSVLIRRARLSTYWRDPDGRLVPWVEPPAGVKRERLHYVADVKELAEQAAQRRAKRESEAVA